jgi:hypothetical protein
MLKWQISRTAVIAVSAGVGVIVGSMFLPALADVINPTQSPTPTDTSDFNYDASATPTPGDPNADSATAEPTPSEVVLPTTPPLASNQVLDGLVAVHQAQVWLQMAQVWNKLCLDEGDYVHAQQQVDYYTSTGELDIANRYQVLLSSHKALVDATNETIGLLQKRLGAINRNSVSTLNLQDQVDQAQLDRAAAQGESDLLVVAAKNGYTNANNQGLDTTLWQSQLNALLSARQLFADSRQAF